ncbi:hypothetical protein [Arthrobacter sp. GMC3]|uniref:hypothetical protein n=1 Tax=Arthrobacter sp. GMC3 TaxID=2058894 RepID=UPI000CE2C3EB|nr:hypothetical protein [Arthrobacter sp. GMC3]
MSNPTSEAIESAKTAVKELAAACGQKPSAHDYQVMLAALTAATPFIAAQAKAEAWDEGAEALTDHWASAQYSPNANGPADPPGNPYRAATIEGKSE